jgi:PEP-CTERM motif
MMKSLNFGVMAMFCVAFAGAASASTVFIDVTGYNGVGVSGGGEFVSNVNGSMMNLFCVDFAHPEDDSNPYGTGGGYSAYVSTSSSYSNTDDGGLSSSAFEATSNSTINSLDGIQRYVVAAWLTTQYVFPNTGNTVQNDNRAVQDAIWEILDPKSEGYSPDRSGWTDSSLINTYLLAGANFVTNTAAYAAFAPDVRIYTPLPNQNGNSCGQEFVGVVPEPATFAMLGAGLLLLGLIRKRRSA